MEKMYCYECDKDVEGKVRKVKTKYEVHNQSVYVYDYVFTCPYCHTEYNYGSLDDNLYKIYDAYLNLYGLSFEKLKKIRKSLHLSQELFAQALGWSKKTIIRYENAESLPQKNYIDVYVTLSKSKSNIYNILKNNKRLTKEAYNNILNKINLDINYKSINTILYVINKDILNRTQLMKYLFGIDFQNFQMVGRSITNFTYVHAPYGPIVDKQNDLINFLVRQDYVSLIVADDDSSMYFKPLQKTDLSCFSDDEIKVLDKVICAFKNKSANELSNWSHKFKGWIETKDGQKINYKYAKYLNIDSI